MSVWEPLYRRHVADCRACRSATNALLFPDAVIPDALCGQGRVLYDEMALESWREARRAAQILDKPTLDPV